MFLQMCIGNYWQREECTGEHYVCPYEVFSSWHTYQSDGSGIFIHNTIEQETIRCAWKSFFDTMSHSDACLATGDEFIVPYTCEDGRFVCCTISSCVNPTMNTFGTCRKVWHEFIHKRSRSLSPSSSLQLSTALPFLRRTTLQNNPHQTRRKW